MGNPTTGSGSQSSRPTWYEIRLQGRLDPRWEAWFEGMTVTGAPGGTTVRRARWRTRPLSTESCRGSAIWAYPWSH